MEDFLPETERRLEEISYVPVTQSIRLERVISQAVLQQSCYTHMVTLCNLWLFKKKINCYRHEVIYGERVYKSAIWGVDGIGRSCPTGHGRCGQHPSLSPAPTGLGEIGQRADSSECGGGVLLV